MLPLQIFTSDRTHLQSMESWVSLFRHRPSTETATIKCTRQEFHVHNRSFQIARRIRLQLHLVVWSLSKNFPFIFLSHSTLYSLLFPLLWKRKILWLRFQCYFFLILLQVERVFTRKSIFPSFNINFFTFCSFFSISSFKSRLKKKLKSSTESSIK